MRSKFLRKTSLTGAAVFGLLLTYLLIAPSPLWIFGDDGMAAEDAVARSLSGFVQHLLAYSVFVVLLLSAVGARRRWVVAILLASAHAVLTEIAQAFIPLRHADWYDVVANGLGIFVGTLLVFAATRVGILTPVRRTIAADRTSS